LYGELKEEEKEKMKAKEMRTLSEKELLKMKKQLEMSRIKASSVWGRDKVKNKEVGIITKGIAKKGDKTSLLKDIRRNIARVNTILNERRIENEKM